MNRTQKTDEPTKTIMALDPGREKCGLAVLSSTGDILLQRVIETARLEEEITAARQHAPALLVLGDGTTSRSAKERIETAFPDLPIRVVNEKHTTEQARREYWKARPPRGWRRLLPTSMQVPPVPVDDFVAVILARRELEEEHRERAATEASRLG